MYKLVTQGLKIKTKCRYVKFTEKDYFNVIEDIKQDCLFIEFRKGFDKKDIIDNRLEILEPGELAETEFIKIHNPRVSLNNLVLTKLSIGDYSFSQSIVKDIEEFTMVYNEYHCDIFIPEKRDFDIDRYVCLINQNPYLEVLDRCNVKHLKNFYSINIGSKDMTLTSTSETRFNTKKVYTKYLLDMVTVFESFLDQLRVRLHDYGVELLSYPIDKNLKSDHKCIYRFTEIGKQTSHKSGSNSLRFAVEHRSTVDFRLSTPDLVLFNDFRNRYQNLDLITNFTEFYTLDKLGRRWISSVEWTPIDTSFNQDYSQDEQGNVGNETSFQANITHYTVFDEKYYRIQSHILDLITVTNSPNNSYKVIVG